MSDFANDANPVILLLDNGSLIPAATMGLRSVAVQLSAALQQTVVPVSLLHSSTIPPEQLGGQAAEILESALIHRLREGTNMFVLVPLFFGPSRALTDYLPRRLTQLKKKFPKLRVRLASPLVDRHDPKDDRMAAILEDRVRAVLASPEHSVRAPDYAKPAVVLVDHGSPVREVTAVRNHVAAQLRTRLSHAVRVVAAASMERRSGPEYAFCEPLLERILDEPNFTAGTVIFAMLFLAPGRHAGPEGDIVQILAAAQQRHPKLHPVLTGLVGSHPGLIPILIDRARAGMTNPPL